MNYFFCENGHIVESSEDNICSIVECDFCKSVNIKNGKLQEPLRIVRCGQCNQIIETIYDVREIFNEMEKD